MLDLQFVKTLIISRAIKLQVWVNFTILVSPFQ